MYWLESLFTRKRITHANAEGPSIIGAFVGGRCLREKRIAAVVEIIDRAIHLETTTQALRQVEIPNRISRFMRTLCRINQPSPEEAAPNVGDQSQTVGNIFGPEVSLIVAARNQCLMVDGVVRIEVSISAVHTQIVSD